MDQCLDVLEVDIRHGNQQKRCTNSCGTYTALRISALSVPILILPSSTSFVYSTLPANPIQPAPPFTPHHHHIKSNLSLPYLIASKRIQRSKPSSCPSTILMTSTGGIDVRMSSLTLRNSQRSFVVALAMCVLKDLCVCG